MGVFRQPPSPHIGGSQPLAPRQFVVQDGTVIADDPPFGSRNPQMKIVLDAWQPVSTPRKIAKGIFSVVDIRRQIISAYMRMR